MSEQKNITYTGPGLGIILFVVFLVLKLTDHIDWSWWWITCPLWIPAAFVLFITVVLLLIALVIGWLEK